MFNGPSLFLAYFDETGDEHPLQRPDQLPVFVIAAIVVSQANVESLARDYLALKQSTLSKRGGNAVTGSELVKIERKGSSLRRSLREGKRGSRGAALQFLDSFLTTIEANEVRVEYSFRVKGAASLPRGSYQMGVTEVLHSVDYHVSQCSSTFLAILDSRTHAKNAPTVAHVFDAMTTSNESLSRLIEPPFFGHSDSHILLQVVDVLVSGILSPMLARGITKTEPNSPFEDFAIIENRYRDRIDALRINSVTGKLTC